MASKPPVRNKTLQLSPLLFGGALLLAVLGTGLYFDHGMPARAGAVAPAVLAMRADFTHAKASAAVRHVALWAVDSGDHLGLPFIIIDKAQARLFAFGGDGRLRASAPVLLGAARGDGAGVPDTPAGRFVALAGTGGGITWRAGGTQLHLRGLLGNTAPGRGARRLNSPSVDDRRISDGSVHAADAFIRKELAPLMLGHPGIAYVLPETRPVDEVLDSYDVDERERRIAGGPRIAGPRASPS